MRILQVVPYFYPYAGPVEVAYGISKKLIERSHEVVMYTSDVKNKYSRIDNESENVNGMKIHYVRILGASVARQMKLFITPEMISTVKEEIKNVDVIHLHEYRTFQNIVISHYAKKQGVPYVLQAHGSLPRIMAKQRLKWIYDVLFGYRLLRDASKVIALSRMEAEQYRGMGVPEEKIAVIPNGIDLSEYGDLPPKGYFKKRFDIDEDEKIALYLGRIHKIKGIDILVKAFAEVNEKLNDVRLVIVGPDDGYLSELKLMIKALKIENNVLIVGPLYGEEKLEAYIDADVYVLPSKYETFPIGLLEAYSCGKPVVASRVGGLKDLVVDEKTGLLVEPGDVKQLQRSMLYLLNNYNKAKEMSLKGRDIVRENFTIEKVVDRLERLYEDAICRQNMGIG